MSEGVFGAIIGVMIFGSLVGTKTLLGGVLIIGSGIGFNAGQLKS